MIPLKHSIHDTPQKIRDEFERLAIAADLSKIQQKVEIWNKNLLVFYGANGAGGTKGTQFGYVNFNGSDMVYETQFGNHIYLGGGSVFIYSTGNTYSLKLEHDLTRAKFTNTNGDMEFDIAGNGFILPADDTSDTAPNDDTSKKRLTIQKLSSPPTNAAYVALTNNPGSDSFYLVLEEG